VCEQIPGAVAGPLCVEGPKLQPECWPEGVPYEVQAGQSFLVIGSSSPEPRTTKVGPEGQCVPDEQRHPLLVNRIPLDAPHCSNVADGTTNPPIEARDAAAGTTPAGPAGTWGNPCLFWGANADDNSAVTDCSDANRYDVGTDGKRTVKPSCHVKALFENSQLRFVVTNLEQFVGDGNITRFDVGAGFSPEIVRFRDDIILTAGVRVVTGPTLTPESQPLSGGIFFPYLYVIDQGRTQSSAGGRGQILRINPRGGSLAIPQFDSNYTLYPFQIQ
jgi:hypothetical protein